jgi:hypothetical protein
VPSQRCKSTTNVYARTPAEIPGVKARAAYPRHRSSNANVSAGWCLARIPEFSASRNTREVAPAGLRFAEVQSNQPLTVAAPTPAPSRLLTLSQLSRKGEKHLVPKCSGKPRSSAQRVVKRHLRVRVLSPQPRSRGSRETKRGFASPAASMTIGIVDVAVHESASGPKTPTSMSDLGLATSSTRVSIPTRPAAVLAAHQLS